MQCLQNNGLYDGFRAILDVGHTWDGFNDGGGVRVRLLRGTIWDTEPLQQHFF